MTIFATLAKRSGRLGMALGWWSELQTNRRAAAGLLIVIMLVAGYGFLSLRDAPDRSDRRLDLGKPHRRRFRHTLSEGCTGAGAAVP
jgi:uncharacterized membrane-anchored protein